MNSGAFAPPFRISHYYTGAFWDSNGPTRALAGWAKAQALAGDAVTILGAPGSSSRPETYPELVTTSAVRHIGSSRMTSVPRKLSTYIATQDVVVLHSAWAPGNVVAAEAARRVGVPYLVMPHGAYELGGGGKRFRSVRAPGERRVLRGATAIHLFFESERALVRCYAPETPCLIAPTGWDLPGARWSGGDDRLLWIGRYSVKHKGLDLLLRALAHIPSIERPRLAMFGEDDIDQRTAVEEMVEQLGLARWVHVDGPVYGSEKTDLLVSCGGYVHPSRWEVEGLALVEALAYGVPTLVSSSIRIANELEDWGAALVRQPSIEDMAKGLSELAVGPAGIGAQARRYISERLNWATIVDDFHAQLARVVESKHA